MGQKINPRSLRLPIDKDWQSKWFAGGTREYALFVVQDVKLRRAAMKKLGRRAGVDRIDIERSPNLITVTVHTAKPGVVIGRGGSGAEELKNVLVKIASAPVKVSVEEIKKPELNATLVAANVASQLERRISFRRAMKMTAENTMKSGAKGVKIGVAGRLNGAEMSRREMVARGSIPLHTLRADIDYAHVEAYTTYGVLGVKVWIYKGNKHIDKHTDKNIDKNNNNNQGAGA
ncbi:MAG TPA: 30S ribosomal protein S3 [Candidatus Dormibacteraeota bacterium]|nr:30S ribosomal protein S3 [Candidatus Dormibacteraeota bacterium]